MRAGSSSDIINQSDSTAVEADLSNDADDAEAVFSRGRRLSPCLLNPGQVDYLQALASGTNVFDANSG